MPAKEVHGAFADIPGVKLWYLDSGGDGTPVVFLHADTGTSASWSNEYADQLGYFHSAGYRAIAFDRRGWGKSVPDPSTGEQPGSVSEDLDALISFLKLPVVHLVGVAGGAFSAVDYASWRPDRVKNVVAAASVLFWDGEIGEFLSRSRIPALSPPSPPVFIEVSAGYRGSSPEGTANWIKIEEHARQPGAIMQPMRVPNSYENLATIETPLLALAGSADLIAPPKLIKLWAAQLKNHEYDEVPGAGHSVAYEESAQFNQIVHKFIKKHDR